LTPFSRAAISTLNVALMLASCEAGGTAIDNGTEGMAA